MKKFSKQNPAPKVIIGFLSSLLLFLIVVGCNTKNNVVPRDGAVKGTIVDKGNRPISGVTVSWDTDKNYYSVTDSSGNFFIDGVNFGEQTFTAQKSGWVPTVFKATIYSNYITPVGNIVLATASFHFSDVKVTKISATHAEISWKTSEFTNGYIEYGETEALGKTVREPSGQYSSIHTLTLQPLKPTTRYYFKIVASRRFHGTEATPIQDFITLSALEDTTPPSTPIGLEAALTEQPNQVTLTWAANTDTDLRGYKIYRSELPSSGFKEVSNAIISKGRERFIDAGLVAGKKYFYRITAIDIAGNESSASDIASVLIPGDIIERVLWLKTLSPYILTGDIDIQNTGVLEIEPGVEVRAADYDILLRGDPRKVEIRVKGSIYSRGTEDRPVVFSSNSATPVKGDWGGILFNRAIPHFNNLSNIVIAYAKTGLAISQASGTFHGIRIDNCEKGVDASNSISLTLASFTVISCNYGFLLTTNTQINISSNTFLNCETAIFSSKNENIKFYGNNFLDYSTTGLSTDESFGDQIIENNLFVSATGVGLYIMKRNPQVQYNTFDSGVAIRIAEGAPLIQKNILVGMKSILSDKTTGIEYLAQLPSLPIFGPNNLYGFPIGRDYIGCASEPTSLAVKPLFMKEVNGNSYDYRLRTALPNNEDYWGIRRDQSPR